MLQFQNFQKSYGHYPVLNIEDLTIEDGIYWVKGVNGSGKSTLLKSVAGFLAFEGDVLLNDISLKKNGVSFRYNVNFAPAEPVYPEFLTGREMISLFSKAKGGTAKQEQALIADMKVEGYLDNPLGTYSSGMLKKLSLVLAFLGRPALILLDEPLNAIDSDSLQVLYNWIETKYRTENISFLLSSHQSLDENRLLHLSELSVERQTMISKI
jgi:ABC-2 type transport system ATP-binding protein